MAFYYNDDLDMGKKGAVNVEVVEEEQADFDEPRTVLSVHPHTLFEGGYARVRDQKGNFVLRVDSVPQEQKRAMRRSFHSRVFDMSTPYGGSELTVYPPWCNGRLRFDEHFPRQYIGTKADFKIDVRPIPGQPRRTAIVRAGQEIGEITQPVYGMGAWEISVLPGMDEPMIVALTTILMQQNVTTATPGAMVDGVDEQTDSAVMAIQALTLLANAAKKHEEIDV